jgi:hypothetical protein
MQSKEGLRLRIEHAIKDSTELLCKDTSSEKISQNLCFIQIQLDVQYYLFSKSFLLYMFRMSSTDKKNPMAVHYSCAADDGCK